MVATNSRVPSGAVLIDPPVEGGEGSRPKFKLVLPNPVIEAAPARLKASAVMKPPFAAGLVFVRITVSVLPLRVTDIVHWPGPSLLHVPISVA
jgi:hypothetical protein